MTSTPSLEATLSAYDLTQLQRETLEAIQRWVAAGNGREFAALDVPVFANTCYQLIVRGWLTRAPEWNEKRPRFVLVDRPPLDEAALAPREYTHTYSAVPDDLFDRVVGYRDVKRALRRTFIRHAPVHHWLWGPPASGKTVFLEEIRERLPNARWIDGATTTPRGIATVLIDEDPDQLLIDEADHLSNEARETLHAVASQGYIRLTNAYTRLERQTAVQIVMTSNTISVAPSFRSRFTLWHFDAYTRVEFAEIGESILAGAGRPAHMGTYIAKRIWDRGGRDIRQVEDVARICTSMHEVDVFLRSPHLVLR